MSAAIRFENVTKRYRLGSATGSLRDFVGRQTSPILHPGSPGRRNQAYIEAVKDLSFEMGQGETMGIIGRNGAGKTTILRMLSGITRPTSGSVTCRGRISALIELGAGFHPDLTGRENVYLNGAILGLKRREVDDLFERIVSFAELEHFIDTPVKRYSSGMYVRLGFAVAAHIRPDVLLVDEVLSVGDVAFQAKCLNRIGELERSGVTVILVSHNMVLVRRYCRRTLLLEQGRKVVDGDTEQAIRAFQEVIFHRTAAGPEDAQKPQMAGLTQRIRVTDVAVADAAGNVVTKIASDKPVKLRIRYEADSSVVNPIFEVVLHSMALGGLLVRLDNRLYGVELGEILPGSGQLDVQLSNLPLKNDHIDVDVSAFSADYSELYDWRSKVASFQVSSGFVGEGLLHIGADWTHKTHHPS